MRFLSAIILCFLIFINAFGQTTGRIHGKITDAETGRGVAGVNVVLSGTIHGASTNTEGEFEISGLPAGNYRVLVSHLSYKTSEQVVEVAAGQSIGVEFQLQPGAIDLSTVLVEGERSYSAASSHGVRKFDLQIRPNRSAQDMLQLAPGLVIAQHAGGGKAEQIFLRGFDADHGTDVAISADGIPVNMVSHGHGQGYADLHFLIPEVVEAIDVFKGPYFARFGNLSTAGSVAFRTKEHIDGNLVKVEGGEFDTRRLTTLFQIPSGGDHQNVYFAGQFYDTDGPVLSEQNFQRFNLFGKFHTHVGQTSKLAFSFGSFGSAWDASGQIPQRAVASGLIDRFGSIDDFEGGTTGRQNINLVYTTGEGSDNEFMIQSYYSRYNFKLFSNFTFFLNDPINGDMIEQTDNRNIVGLNSEYKFRRFFGSRLAITTVGGGFRGDDMRVQLWHSPDRVRQQLNVDADIAERNLYLWVEEELVLNPMLRVQLGLRGDYFTFNVEDRLDLEAGAELPHASGYVQKSLLSPKFNLVFSPLSSTDFYLNAGSSFHSNDARDVVIAQRISEVERSLRRKGLSDEEIDAELAARNFDPEQRGIETLPRAIGAELGMRTHLSKRVIVGVAAWWLQLEEELVFIGDEGATEISGKTRRIGLDLEGRVQLLPWLWADADLNLSRGTSVDEPNDADEIPLAPRLTSTGGLTAIHPSGFEGSLRYRHIGDRPANEFDTVTAEGYSVVNLSLGYRFGRTKVFANIENLLDTEWNEAQFDTESRLQNESAPVSEIHFTPGNPRNVQLGVSLGF
jgi:outer membrane receptor protein involved in Fe transport